MRKTIQEIISGDNDFDVCNEVFGRIGSYYGEQIDAAILLPEHRAVVLAWHSSGIIGNGGFNYLFEGTFDGDPDFALTAEAFEVIRCEAAAQAFRRALAVFPKSKPPSDIERRLVIFRRGTSEDRHEIDSTFFKAMDDITKCLALFIRSNRERFYVLDQPNPRPKKAAKVLRRESKPSKTAAQIMKLPHWARVAYAARCARHVLRVFDLNWPNSPTKYRQAVLNAIGAAEYCAAKGHPNNDLSDVIMHATITIGAALGGIYGVPKGREYTGPPDGNMSSVAASAAKAAAKAAEAARAPASESTELALESCHLAYSVAANDMEMIGAMADELRSISLVAMKGAWSDATAVPRTVFELLA